MPGTRPAARCRLTTGSSGSSDDWELARARAAAKAGLPDSPTWTDVPLRMASNDVEASGRVPLAVKERLRVYVDALSGLARLRDGAHLPPGRVTTPASATLPPGPAVTAQLTEFDKGCTSGGPPRTAPVTRAGRRRTRPDAQLHPHHQPARPSCRLVEPGWPDGAG